MTKKKVALAYSGGLDTSVCIRYLQKIHDLDVVTVTVDCGQNEDFVETEKKSLDIGSLKHVFIDAKDEFVSDYIVPSIRANGLYQEKYPLATALARPLIAKKTVEIAHKENCNFIAHGCTGKGNDQVRFDVTIKSLDPSLGIIAPIRDMNLTRDVEIDFARKENIQIDTKVNNYSIDVNIWGRSIEGGNLEDVLVEPPLDCFQLVKFDSSKTQYLEIEFENGIPVSLDGVKMSLISMIDILNKKAGNCGIGVVDHIEDRIVGIKSREIYEAPAAITLIEAHKDLEKMVLTSQELRFKHLVDNQWGWLAYSGLWLDPLRTALDAFINETQKRVNGKIRMKMHNGGLRVVGRYSDNSLYKNELATYESGSLFNQELARGFVELWGLQSITANTIINNLNKGKKYLGEYKNEN
ncbi:MAG: argininosuccinate synthase [Nitrososphaeraceae archaeon]|nr:argininosuccinate synthase [Nitrososphaeraceae archaeon]